MEMYMKNLSKILLIVLSLSMLCVPVIASSSLERQYVGVDGVEITVDNCSEKVFNMIIRDMTSNDEVQSSDALNYIGIRASSNVLCSTFGHSLETGYVERTTHEVYSTAPKCKEEIYYYEACKRSGCDYSYYSLRSLVYIYCH